MTYKWFTTPQSFNNNNNNNNNVERGNLTRLSAYVSSSFSFLLLPLLCFSGRSFAVIFNRWRTAIRSLFGGAVDDALLCALSNQFINRPHKQFFCVCVFICVSCMLCGVCLFMCACVICVLVFDINTYVYILHVRFPACAWFMNLFVLLCVFCACLYVCVWVCYVCLFSHNH